jgi:hypothetical protein
MHLLRRVSNFLCLVVLAAAGFGAEQRMATLRPASQPARLLKVQSGYAVWLVSQLVPETAGNRAPSFTHRFYRQRLTEPDAALIYELVDTSVPFLVAIRDDGSMLLDDGRRRLHYVPIAGPPVVQEVKSLDSLALDPDGVLATDWSVRAPSRRRPVQFVPFDGGRFRVEAPVQVIEAGVKSFRREEGLRYPGEPCRLGDLFAWIADSTLHTFDLATGKRTQLRLSIQLDPSYRASAFDGATVVSGPFAFDAVSGEQLGAGAESQKRRQGVPYVFAVRNRIGYYYEQGSLMATDLTSTEGRSVKLREAAPIVPLQSAAGLTIWTGKEWAVVAWLKELPPP